MRIGKPKHFYKVTVVLLILTSFFTMKTLIAKDTLVEPIEKEVDLEAFELESNIFEIDITFSDIKLEANKQQAIEVKDKQYTTSGSIATDSDRFIDSGSLTDASQNDLWFFTVDSNRTIIFQLDSDNSDYFVELYRVDWSNGTATPMGLKGQSGETVAHSSLPEGDWALVVNSKGEVGQPYTIRMNATNPQGATGIVSASTSLQYLVLSYGNGDVYANGSYVFNELEANDHLDWERNFVFEWDGNYNRRLHKVSSVKIKSISAPVSYQASYASSNNAILIYLDRETLFTHFEAYFRSGPPTQYENSFVDTIGKVTPRRLDADDLTNWGDHILVYDLDTNQTIDFFSVLNYYYASGAEAIPTINYLN
ncbi:hypothetical protein [Amphibacillus cookii]|uniref:hypothetical protein n=1 Tax=Amphibacillus cookii TaxID=767787 RepID=UPI001EF90688|nr:hypothetical protein [Amphibacillus cookii]MBM7540040.1 hypothetical protein [Amphibacillus cookii]